MQETEKRRAEGMEHRAGGFASLEARGWRLEATKS